MATGKPNHGKPAPRSRRFAKELRRNPTEPERRLWRALRTRLPLRDSHFRRQVCLGPYVVDFCCLAAKLVIEIDGEQHGWPKQAGADAKRDHELAKQGFTVLRFSNHAVNFEIDGVVETIWHALNIVDHGATPTPNPSSQGEGEALVWRSRHA